MIRHAIFVTGATGFIGGHLVRRLAEEGHALRCLVRPDRDVRHLETLGADIVRGDLDDPRALADGMQGCDRVVHLAGIYSFWERDPSVFERVNVEGTRKVMECALEAGVGRVVHVSTALAWGLPEATVYDEDTPVATSWPSEYGRTKCRGDRVAWELHETRGLPLVVLHPGGVTGPGDSKASGDYVRELAAGHLPARVAQRHYVTYVHVGDVAEAIERVLDHAGAVGQRYILADRPLTVGEVNGIVREASGVRLPLLRLPDGLALASARCLTWLADRIGRPPPWGMSRDQIRTMVAGFRCDGSRAAKELGLHYTPVRVAFEEALRAAPQTHRG